MYVRVFYFCVLYDEHVFVYVNEGIENIIKRANKNRKRRRENTIAKIIQKI